MERLSPSQARDHIEMVDHILSRSERSFRVGGEFFLIWGIWAAAVPLTFQLVLSRVVPIGAFAALPVLLAAAIVFSVVRGRQIGKRRDGLSLLQREFFAVLSISLGVTMVAAVLGYRLFPAFASSALWNVAAAIVLFFIASHGNRRALAGAIVMIASIAAANFLPAFAGYALAAGMLFGYAGFGLASLIARD
jgi:small-conductance mechanosensitive channel